MPCQILLIAGLSRQLSYLDLLHPHKHVDYVVLKPDMLAKDAAVDLVLAVVAGYDRATFGLPNAQRTFPLLVRFVRVFLQSVVCVWA